MYDTDTKNTALLRYFSDSIASIDQHGHMKSEDTIMIVKDSKKDFDLEIVLTSFKKCLQNEHSLNLHEYLNAFYELCRFFKLMNTIFGFVAKDIETKINFIQYHINKSNNSKSYHSIQSMISHEIAEGKTYHKGIHPSGSRTLLRLHHALEFILAFMEEIGNSTDDAKTSKIAWDVYCQTLKKHHPWLTQKLAFVAVYALPSKQDLIEIMCKQELHQVKQLLHHVIIEGKRVYDITEDIYRSNDILHIP